MGTHFTVYLNERLSIPDLGDKQPKAWVGEDQKKER